MNSKNNEGVKWFDNVIRMLPFALTILTIILTYWYYRQDKKQEYSNEIYKLQINYYSELSEAIGEIITVLTIHTSSDSLYTNSNYYAKKNKFLNLYYGKRNMINDSNVTLQLNDFKNVLDSIEAENVLDLALLEDMVIKVNNSFRETIKQEIQSKED